MTTLVNQFTGTTTRFRTSHQMLDLTFLLIFFATPVIVLSLYRCTGEPITKVTIPTLLIFTYFIFGYAGILALHFHLDAYRESMGVVDPITTFKMLVFSAGVLLLLVLGMVVGSRFTRLKGPPAKIAAEPLRPGTVALVMLLVAASVAVTSAYLLQLDKIPLLTTISDGSAAGKLARSNATNAFTDGYHWYAMFFDTIIPFCLYILFSHALTKKKLGSWLLFVLILIIACFTSLMLAIKAKLAFLAIGLFLCYLATKDRQIHLRNALVITAIGTTIMAFTFILFMGLSDRPISAVLGRVASRTLTGQITPAYFYLEMFPRYEDFLMGRTLPNPGSLFPWQPYRITVEVMNYMYPELKRTGMVGSAPTVFWADLYANFGALLPFFLAPFIGFGVQLVHATFQRLRPSPITYAASAWFGLITMKLAFSSLGQVLFSTHTALAVILTVGLLLYEWRGRIYFYKTRPHPDTALYRG